MKVHITIDMTPEEARAFMGLADVAQMQRQMLDDMRGRMTAAFDTGDPEAMVRAWTPFGGAKAFEQFQKLLWDTARAAAGGKGR
jgi:hypothetical protein